MTDLDAVESAIDTRARTAAASLHRAAAHREVASARPVPSARRRAPLVLAVGALALVAALLVVQWQRRDDVASRPLDPPVYVIDGWDITAADLPTPDEWPASPGSFFPSARATYLATPDLADGPAAVVLVTSMPTFGGAGGPVTEGRAGGYEVVLTEGQDGRRHGEIRTDLTDPNGQPLMIQVQTIGLSEDELLTIVGSLELLDDRTPTVNAATLPRGLTTVATDGYWRSRLPIVAGMDIAALAEIDRQFSPFQIVEQGSRDRRVRVVTMPFNPATWVLTEVGMWRRPVKIGDAAAWAIEPPGAAERSVILKLANSMVMLVSEDLTSEELVGLASAARAMTEGEVPEQALGIAGEALAGDRSPATEAPAATEAPYSDADPALDEAAPADTDPPAVAPDPAAIVDVPLSIRSETRSRNEVRLSGELPNGQPFGADVAVVFDRISTRNWYAPAAVMSGSTEAAWGDEYLIHTQAGDTSADDWLDQRVVSTDRAEAVAFEALSSDGRRYRTDLLSVPARPEVRFALIAMKHGTWVSARLVDANGDTLVAYDANGMAVAG